MSTTSRSSPVKGKLSDSGRTRLVRSKSSCEPTTSRSSEHSRSSSSRGVETALLEPERKVNRGRRSSSRSSFDGHASLDGLRSSTTDTEPTSSLNRRPSAVVRERVPHRSNTSQDEAFRHGTGPTRVEDDDQESGHSRSGRHAPASVRDRLSSSQRHNHNHHQQQQHLSSPTSATAKGPSSSDDALIVQLMQKVRQLEREKEQLASKHSHPTEQERRDHHTTSHGGETHKATTERATTPPPPSSREKSSFEGHRSPVVSELESKLKQAMMKIARLEEDQARQEDLEDKYQDAQVAIVNLQLHSMQQSRSFDNSETADFYSVWSGSSGDEEELVLHEADEGGTPHKPFRGRRLPSSSVSSRSIPRTRSASMDTRLTASSASGDSEARREKLIRLKEFRKRREHTLKELVLDQQQNPPTTDMQALIQNLQDQLKAAKIVILGQQQKIIRVRNEGQLQPQPQPPDIEKEDNADSKEDESAAELAADSWKEKYQELNVRYTQLELNRALGEFELRDRITDDALKFHRRLGHWKQQTELLQQSLDDCVEKHAEEKRELQIQVLEKEEAMSLIEHDFESYKSGMHQTLVEYDAAKKQLAKLRAKEHTAQAVPTTGTSPPRARAPPASFQSPGGSEQAQLLEAALYRKEKVGWSSPAWIREKFAKGGTARSLPVSPQIQQ